MYRVINILKENDIYNSIAYPEVILKLKDIFKELNIYINRRFIKVRLKKRIIQHFQLLS